MKFIFCVVKTNTWKFLCDSHHELHSDIYFFPQSYEIIAYFLYCKRSVSSTDSEFIFLEPHYAVSLFDFIFWNQAIVFDSSNVTTFSLCVSACKNIATATVKYMLGKPHTYDNVNCFLMFIALTLKYLYLENTHISNIKEK